MPTTTEKKWTEAYKDYREYQHRRKQFNSAVHHFHDLTADYDESIGKLSTKEIATWQKDFARDERVFHEAMDSFEKSLQVYQNMVRKLTPELRRSVIVLVNGKKVKLKIVKGDLKVTESE